MGKVAIVDDVIWTRRIDGDPRLRERVLAMKAGDFIDLEVDGVIGRWERMRDGRDGRPSHGIKPIAEMREVWSRWRKQPPRMVEVREVLAADSYLAALSDVMGEWASAEDEQAYRDL